jgi:hypothetical protein
MRAVLLAAALGLSACSVEVEGAACSAAGDTAECPSGQRCGLDLKCSTRAASATCALCPRDATRCGTGSQSNVEKCSHDSDSVCGNWEVSSVCGADQECDGSASDHVCRCAVFTVDPAGAAAQTACRYAAIKDAIKDAGDRGKNRVLLGGDAGQTYGTALADANGIDVPAGMMLAGADSPPAPGSRILVLSGGSEGVKLGAGASLFGVKVRRGSGGPLVAVRVTGTSPVSAASLDTVIVDKDGSGAFEIGVLVEGSGGVRLDGIQVLGATAAGMDVARIDVDQAVVVNDAVLDGNAIGVKLERGDLTLSTSRILRSSAEGISSQLGQTGLARLTVLGGIVARGLSVGVAVTNLDLLDLEQTQICGNAGRNQSLLSTTRLVGGFLALGRPPSQVAIKANNFHDNGGDQVFIGGTSTPWSLGAASCDGVGAVAPNVLAGYSAPGVGLAAVGAPVDATAVSWKTIEFPSGGTDFISLATGTVTIANSLYCLPLATPVCPQ